MYMLKIQGFDVCNGLRHKPCIDDPFQEQLVRPSLQPVLPVLIALVLCRLCRMWNQTGDKWSHLLDLGDWLVM